MRVTSLFLFVIANAGCGEHFLHAIDDTAELYDSRQGLVIEPASLDFGPIAVGDSAAATLHIINDSDEDLAVESVFLDRKGPHFDLDPRPNGTLRAGSAWEVTMTFTPQEPGELANWIHVDTRTLSTNSAVVGHGVDNSR